MFFDDDYKEQRWFENEREERHENTITLKHKALF